MKPSEAITGNKHLLLAGFKMNFGPEIVVVVSSSSVPTKFRAEDSPTWGIILQQLNLEHGPGVLKDGQGYNKLLNNASMDQAVPLGTYDYITENATGQKQLVINIPDNLRGKHGRMHLEAAANTDFDAPKQADWTDAETPSEEQGITLKWEVVEGCCMTVHWPTGQQRSSAKSGTKAAHA
ncbi:hypothetical protein WJX84_002676 [Apatococcus fuscideae]|uniref:Uncharacterized protein n=1 Tax=Apatococcus fuscideae TaxID=2026836 RepID=A0AAW1SNX2_9CHLO